MGFGFLARPWLTSDRRLQFGRHIQLKADSSFPNYIRMEPKIFDEILNRFGLESERVTSTSGKHLNQA